MLTREQIEERYVKAINALALIYGLWENGDPCHENADPASDFMGNAFILFPEDENEIVGILNSAGIIHEGDKATVEYIRALESQAAPGTDGVHPVVRVTSYGMYEIIGPDGQIIATVESEKTADSIAKAIVFGPIAAPGKVVAGEGWKQKLRKSLDDLMENHLCENSTALQGMIGLKALESILDEVTELPAIKSNEAGCLFSLTDDEKHWKMPLIERDDKHGMLYLASSLIVAATQPQKGNG